MLQTSSNAIRGRTVLLNAVSTVLEYLYWPDARTFHNKIMSKIEQGRLDWDSNFIEMAEEHIDNKLRKSYKSKSGAYAGSGRKGYFGYKNQGNFNKGYGNSSKGYGSGNKGFNKYSGKNKSLYSSVCRQWNFGTCTYGDRCNLWHICWTCADNGKVGEAHKGSTHENSGNGSSTGVRQANQRT